MIMEKVERVYNVPLGDAYLTTRVKAARRAVTLLREFVKRHAKVEGQSIRLSSRLNQYVWARGRKKPPRHVKIRLVKEDGIARAYLHDEKIEEKKAEEKKAPAVEKKDEEKKTSEKKESVQEAQESKK